MYKRQTEYGTLYSKEELKGISEVCREYSIPLFMDGARLGYGLASPESDLTLPLIAEYCDVFYIGGTKVGAFWGKRSSLLKIIYQITLSRI